MRRIGKVACKVLDFCVSPGMLAGVAVGLSVGVGAMHLRFGEEIDSFDTAQRYVSSCAFALTTFAEHPNLELILNKTN